MTTPLTPEMLQEFSELGPYSQVGHTIVRPTTDPNDDPDHIERYATMGSVMDAAKLTDLLNHAPDEITALRQRVAELEAVVKKLPWMQSVEVQAYRLRIGMTCYHPDGRKVYIVSGQYMGERGLSNHWGWCEVMPDGSLGSYEYGYGWNPEEAALAARKEVQP